MINFTGVARAPLYHWEVMLVRNKSLNEYQNSRRRIEYVQAPNEEDAKREAKRKNPQFFATSARRV
jgi:hypothetical protein